MPIGTEVLNSVTYPKPFIATPIVTMTPFSYAGTYYSIGVAKNSSTTTLVYGIKAIFAFVSDTTYQNYIAIGRWK